MLRLQIRAPGNLVFELVIILLQDLDRFCIGHSGKIRGRNMAKPFKQPLIDK